METDSSASPADMAAWPFLPGKHQDPWEFNIYKFIWGRHSFESEEAQSRANCDVEREAVEGSGWSPELGPSGGSSAKDSRAFLLPATHFTGDAERVEEMMHLKVLGGP